MNVTHKINKEEKGGGVRLQPLIAVFAIGLVGWFIPHPLEISDQAWHLLVIFLGTILAIVLRPMPVAAIVLVGMVMAMITQTVSEEIIFAAYGKSSIWLIAISFFLARGLVKTGLAMRISYYFVQLLGKHTLGLVYGIGASELFLATIIPSLIARSGGIIYPIILATTENLKKDNPHTSVARTNGFLMVSGFQLSAICSAMFMTAMAANPIIVEIAEEFGITITWGTWASAAFVPGIVSILVVPYVLSKMMNIEIKQTPKAPILAKEKLIEMGPISNHEWIMMGTFFIVVFLWIFGENWGIESTTAAMFGIAILLVTGVLEWKDCIQEETAWATLFWLGGLIAMGNALKTLGLFDWLSVSMIHQVGNLNWMWGLLILSLFYFYSHYLFASNTAHVMAMFSVFLATAIQIGSPPLLAALIFAYFSNLFGGLTHYSSGPAPIFYASHYVSLQRWWYYGLVSSVVNIVIWLGVGGLWWKWIGVW